MKSIKNTKQCNDMEPGSHSMYLFSCSFQVIVNLIKSLKSKHTTGIDEVSFMLLIKSCYVDAPCLRYLTNLSLISGVFPESLKYAKNLALHKSERKLDLRTTAPVENYCSISLLCISSEIFEKVYTQNCLMT